MSRSLAFNSGKTARPKENRMVEFGHKKINLFVILFIYIYASPPPKRSYLMVVPYVYIICYCEPSLFVLPAYEAYEESPLLQHHSRIPEKLRMFYL